MANDNILRLDLGDPQGTNTSNQAIQLDLNQDPHQDMELPPEAYQGTDTSRFVVTEMIATPGGADQKRLLLIGVGLICLSLTLALVLFSDDESNPLAILTGLISPEPPPRLIVRPVKKVIPTAKVAKVPENPYWDLPNQTLGSQNAAGRQWTTAEEAMWRVGMTHRFPYQHLKTVTDIRTFKLKGSEVILWEALGERKLWTRMEAVLGLADMGISVGIDSVEKALGTGRSELVNNYFKRFNRPQTEGERFILRQAIRLVEADARREILKALALNKEPITHLYLVAATYDPGRGIKEFANAELYAQKVAPEAITGYRNFILGLADLPADFTAAPEKPLAMLKADFPNQKKSASEYVSKVEYFQSSAERINEDGVVDEGLRKVDVIEIR